MYPPDALYDSHPRLWELWLNISFLVPQLPFYLSLFIPLIIGLFSLYRLANTQPKIAKVTYLLCVGIAAALSSYAIFFAYPWMIGYNMGSNNFVVFYLVIVGSLPIIMQVSLFIRMKDLRLRKMLLLTMLYTPILALISLMILGAFGLHFETD